MDGSRLFVRLRTTIFCCINFICFTWIILYSVVIFLQWEAMDPSERALISVMSIVNVITLFTLLILLLLEFRVWLDVARICFLLVAQIGTAGAFVYWRPLFHCEEKVGDEQGLCSIISFYGLISSWISPVLLILYLTALAVRAYHRHHLMVDPTISNSHLVTEETTVSTRHSDSTRPSLLPITDTSRAPISLHFLQEDYRKTLNTRSNSVSIPPRYSLSPATPSLNVNPGRLSKRSPLIDHV